MKQEEFDYTKFIKKKKLKNPKLEYAVLNYGKEKNKINLIEFAILNK